jgi:hypothetical protein
MTDDERSICGKMNNFFSGLLILVNFADECAEALKKFANLYPASCSPNKHPGTDQEGKVECGTIRLIIPCSKAFAKGVDEKSGVCLRAFQVVLISREWSCPVFKI